MSKSTHTCGYEVGIDKEILVGNDLYYAAIDLDVDFNADGEAIQVEVIKAEIEGPAEGQIQSWTTEGRRLEKIIIEGNPALTEAIDKALWDAIDEYSSDYAYEICRDVETDYEERASCWGSDL